MRPMKIVTSLSFQGKCREAFEFYAKVLGGKITAAMPYGDAPPGMPISANARRIPVGQPSISHVDSAVVPPGK